MRCDNTAALFSLWKGASSDKLLNMISQRSRKLLSSRNVLLAARWIPSIWNPADAPTKTKFEQTYQELIRLLKLTNEHSDSELKLVEVKIDFNKFELQDLYNELDKRGDVKKGDKSSA